MSSTVTPFIDPIKPLSGLIANTSCVVSCLALKSACRACICPSKAFRSSCKALSLASSSFPLSPISVTVERMRSYSLTACSNFCSAC